MRREMIGVMGAAILASTLAIVSCSSPGPSQVTGGDAGGTSSGGSSGSGGGAGGSSGGSGGPATGGSFTTLNGSANLSSLSATQADKLCSDAFAYISKSIDLATLCKASGLKSGLSTSPSTDAQLQQYCKAQQMACLATGQVMPKCDSLPQGCMGTVAEYAACITDEVAAYSMGAGALPSCQTVTLKDLPTIENFGGDAPASCATLSNACPGINPPSPQEASGGSVDNYPSSSSSSSGGSSGGGSGSGSSSSGSPGGSSGSASSSGSGSSSGSIGGGGTLPGDVAQSAGTPFVAAHAMTRTLFTSYKGPLFRALRVSDMTEKDIGSVSTGLADLATLSAFCSGTSCKVTTLYDQSGNGNDMWRADNPNMNQPGTNKPCALMDIQYWPMSDGTKVPIAVETNGPGGATYKTPAQCLRNRDKTKNMPVGAKPQTEYAIFHAQYLNNNCCFNYGNTGNAIHYSGPGTLSALNFSKMTIWSAGTGNGPWPMVDFETGVYTGNTGKCGSGIPSTVACTTSGQNPNPSVTFDIVTTLFKHNGVDHWALKTGNAKAGALSVNGDYPALPKGYSPLKQEGGLGLGEGGAGDSNGAGGFSEGAVMAGETTDGTDNALQSSIVSVYGK